MSEPTKLDDVRAAILRGMSADLPVWHRAHGFFAEEGLCVGGVVTDLGRAALAAYDAEQRRAIRAEVIAECASWALARAWSDHSDGARIAQDITENVKP